MYQNNFTQPDELDNELNINLKKIHSTIWNKRKLLIKVFCYILVFFILMTFILPKKYEVSSEIFINKTNSSNMKDINPYILDESSGTVLSMGVDKYINNELELIKSDLVLDKVIRENNLVYKKFLGIIPTKRTGEYISAKKLYNKGKKLKIENIKNTNVISISYTAKKPELAYGIVSSLITNYIELHKEINTEKSKTDKELLESEYKTAKANLDKKLQKANGLPAQSLTGIGNLSAMSAFSKSASNAMGTIKHQFIEGERSQIEVTEESQKVAKIAAKLEWAKMVEQMSDTSKVLIINEPKKLRPFENTSPKLLINIILGIVFGFIGAIAALVYSEITDKKLCYSVLTDNIIFDGIKDIDYIKAEIIGFNPKKILMVALTELPQELTDKLKSLSNCEIIYADLTEDFINKVIKSDKIMLISKIQSSNRASYEQIKSMIKKQQKEILYDVLV